MKRIFIGGIGRSGTTIALNALYRHPDVYAVPLETKFLVEEDGFADLVAALTSGFSTAGATVACQRFEALMRQQVPGLVEGKFTQQHVLSSDVFPAYHDALDRFTSLIHRRRYFADRAPLLAASRRFIAATFDLEAQRSNKSCWVEKTPANIWRIGFLRELWPDCVVVHMAREPRAIMLSLMERSWLPSEMLPALTIFEGYMAALLEVRRAWLADPGFVEIRLEDLVADTPGILDRLADRLGLARFDAAAVGGLSQSIAEYYRNKAPLPMELSETDLALAEEILRPAAIELDYYSAA